MKSGRTGIISLFTSPGLVFGVLFGLFMPGRYEFLLPALVCL